VIEKNGKICVNKYIIKEQHKIYGDTPKVNTTDEQLHVFDLLALSSIKRYENWLLF
jgi:hypothetical protein